MSIGVKIFSGRASKHLAESIAAGYGIPLGDVKVTEFSDGEFQPSFEETVRGQDVFIIQSTMPPSDNLFEFRIMVLQDRTEKINQELRLAQNWLPTC